VGTPGQTVVVIGVYGFKYAAWLSRRRPKALTHFSFCYSHYFFSSSSIFLFFYNVLKFNRTLCYFALFSVVCALTRPWVGTTSKKQELCQAESLFKNHGIAS